MDNHGLLGLTRQLNMVLTSMKVEKYNAPPTWEWKATPVIMPESKCPFCLETIRSNGIWFLGEEKNYRLVGMLDLNNKRVELVQPSHPHNTGGGYLCLGSNKDGIALLAAKPNIDDAPMGVKYIPRWLKKYWGHPCEKARQYLISWDWLELLREYDKL